MRIVFMILYFFFIRALPLKFRVKEGKITMYLSAFFALLFVKITFFVNDTFNISNPLDQKQFITC